MARDGQGNYNPPLNNWNPALDGNEADPASWNQLLADLTSALSQSVSSDGQTMLTGNLKMGGNTLQGMGAPSGNGQALRRDQLTKGPNIESASTITIPAEGSVFEVTGTTTINQMSGAFDGRMVVLVFQEDLIIKHGPNLQLPSATDITTKAGDAFVFYRKSSSEWAALYGTTALTEIGTDPDQVPTNELLGSAAVGTMAGGSIIERGSNANGEYVKFADGTQWCWGIQRTGGDITDTIDAAQAQVFWTYPTDFIAPPALVASIYGSSDTSVGFNALGLATAPRGLPPTSTDSSEWIVFKTTIGVSNKPPVDVSFTAIGRWK